MASTYSNNLKIELITTGEKATTWGSITNINLGTALEESIVGSADVTFSSSDLSISLTNSNSTQAARNIRLNLTGTTGGTDRTLTVPDIEKTYIINNGCADAVAISNSAGSTVSVPAGKTMWVYSTGSNVVDVTTHLTSLTVGATPSNVVTETATQTLTNKTLTGPAVTDLTGSLADGVTATTQSTGDDTTKVATTAFVADALGSAVPSGAIFLWSGSVASIPSGYVLCDGTNSTPDLRNRFVIGAGDTYAVDATGGSADLIVPAHTHNITDPGHFHTISPADGGYNSAISSGAEQPVFGGSNTSTETTGITIDEAGESATNANLPPYYALAYIMKT